MTLLQLQQRLARRRGAASSTLVSATATRYQDALNEAHKAVLRTPGLASLRYGYLTLASVAGQQNYAVPHEGVARIDRMWDPVNRRKLDYLTLDQVREDNPSAIQGTPYAYAPLGYIEVLTQPSDASAVFVKSTSASDVGLAYVEGFVTGGYYRTASVTMTGVTAVNVSSAISTFILITKFYVATAAVGTISLNEDSGSGTELSRITIGRTRARYYALLLEPVPSAVITYSMDVLREIPDMTVATDEPLLPEDFHDLLIDMAELKELRKQDDPARYGLLTGQVTQAKRDLTSFVVNHPDWRPQWADQGVQTMGSQLGSFYPAGT